MLVQSLVIGEVALLPITSLSDYMNQHVLDMRKFITIILVNDMKVIKRLYDLIVKLDTVGAVRMNEINVLTYY
jgi:hypothetical protein